LARVANKLAIGARAAWIGSPHTRTKKDITIVVEPTAAAANLIETADDAMELMRSVARNNVKVKLDTLHALYRSEIPADYVRMMGKNLVHVHVSDRNRVLPGEGRVDWVGLMASVKRIKLNRPDRRRPTALAPLSVSPRKALECSSLAVANPSWTVKFT
jgi:sugar phosphate isomerase/epimerase